MIRVGPAALQALFLVLLMALASVGAENGTPGPVEQQFLDLRKEYQGALKGVEGNDEKKHALAAAFAPRFFALGTKNAEDEAAPDPLLWILINAPSSAEMPKAAKLLERQYIQSPRLKPKLQALNSVVGQFEFSAAFVSRSWTRFTMPLLCGDGAA